LGVPGVTAEDFRDAFTRPFSVFYRRLLGRSATDAEYAYIRARYEREYLAEVNSVGLQADAEDALDLVHDHATQSILSMAPDDHLQSLIDQHGLRHRFVRIEGNHTGSSDGNKADSLCRHLEAVAADPALTVLIGDTVDDGEAATSCGARAVLVTTGSQSRDALEATGSPVVDTLREAARVALAP
jgi:phosphoglycolate phosphatase-like HAD superfamily hydrolase